MQKFAILMIVSLCFGIEAAQQVSDEPLSKQTWSNFGPLCRYYVAGRREKPEAVYRILKKYVNPHDTILDLGSGTGISTRQLYKNGFKNVIGVDRDPLMINEARAVNSKECTIKYIQADVSNELPFPDEQFDVVSASSAFHWFANPSSIREVARILKTQGYYFVIGSSSRVVVDKGSDPIKENIRHILDEARIPSKSKQETIPCATALEEQGFKIILETTVPYVNEYTKEEYLNYIQSRSYWNLVKESQRGHVLRKIDKYLDTVLNENGRIKQEGSTSVILGQKVANTQRS